MILRRQVQFHPFDLIGSPLSLFHLDIGNQQQCYSHCGLAGGRHLKLTPIISNVQTSSHESIMFCSVELNQNSVSQCALLLVAHLVCALRSYPEQLVRSICDHEQALRLRPIQFVPCALLLGSSLWPSNDPRIGICLSTQPSDQSLSTICQLVTPVTSLGIAVHCILRVYFCSSTTFCAAVCLNNSQTEVCLLCVGAVLGTTIGITICCISRPSFLPGTTLGIFVCLHSPQIGVCPLCVGVQVSLAPSTLLSIFAALRPESIRCVLRFPLSYNFRHRRPLHPKNLLCAQHDSRRCHLSSQPSDYSLSTVYWDFYFVLPNTTFGVVVRLRSPQTRVCPLCTGACLT